MAVIRRKCPTCGGDAVELSGGELVHANEREHTEALAEVERKETEVERLREALAELHAHSQTHLSYHGTALEARIGAMLDG